MAHTVQENHSGNETFTSSFASFDFIHQWVSDRIPHFKNELVRLLGEKTHSEHLFTLCYCLLLNGTLEVVNRELFKTF